jgi:hypothetical protein
MALTISEGVVRKRFCVLLLGLLLTAAIPSISLGGSAFTLHPAGKGAQSYASWKANVGEPDSNGIGNQAIYMQKLTSTADTSSLGVVVIRGFVGEPTSSLTGLQWDRPTTGSGSHCQASPKWQISVNTPTGNQTSTFGSCGGQLHFAAGAQLATWTRDVCNTACIPTFPSGSTINSLAIVFLDGNETVDPWVLLDNIKVTGNSGDHTWTSASDNGTAAALNIGPSVAFADIISDVLGDLLFLFPDVPVTDWTLYTGIDLTPLP